MLPSERIEALVAGEPPGPDEQRLARVIYELQAARPPAPEALRARIDALASVEPTRRPSLLERLSFRRAVLLLAPAIVVVAVGAAVVQGIVSATSEDDKPIPFLDPEPQALREGTRTPPELRAPSPQPPVFRAAENSKPGVAPQRGDPRTAAVPTSPGRTQDYYAALRLRVDDLDDLSERTQQTLRMTRRYGGYVASTSFRNPRSGEGDATLELRVPIRRVHEAVVAFSELGSIISQRVTIRDLQGRIDRYTRDIRRLRDRIVALRASLLDPELTAAERRRIETELARARSRVAALEQERRVRSRRGRFAKISLALTTQKPMVKQESPGRIKRAVEDAGSVLAKEVAFGLYALIVAAPFLLLIALALFGARAGRRRADQRLLERA
jgi:Domain of unknown function (DUF4349)